MLHIWTLLLSKFRGLLLYFPISYDGKSNPESPNYDNYISWFIVIFSFLYEFKNTEEKEIKNDELIVV